jgi:putative flippase GtrA
MTMQRVASVSDLLAIAGTTAAGMFSRGESRLVPQFSRYSLVSVVALSVDFGFYMLLCALAVMATLAGIVAYATGMVVHYILSSRFVFDTAGSEKSQLRQFFEFAVSGIIGIALTGFVIAVATETCGFGPVVAKVIATGISFVAVFAIRRVFVFGSEDQDDAGEAAHRVYAKSASSL